MRTLYELAISTAIKTGADITELPDVIRDHILNYQDHPIPLQFPDRFDAKVLLEFADCIKHPLDDDELWQINRPASIKGYLTQFEDPFNNYPMWMRFCKTLLKYVDTCSKGQKVQAFKKLYQFFYTNSGIFNGAISYNSISRFIRIAKEKHIELVALDEWKYFDNDDRELCNKLWGINVFVLHKKQNWDGIHNELGKKMLILNHQFPSFELDNIWLQRAKYPYNITQSIYWRDILKRVRLGEAIDHWEFRVSEGDDWIWLYRGIEIFRQILHEDGYLAEIDWTFCPPKDIWTNNYKNVLADVMAEYEEHKPWSYSYRDDRFGYYRNQWYYEGQLVYEEGFDDFYGFYSHDHTTDIIRVEEMPLCDPGNEAFLENVLVVYEPRLLYD